jgi:pyridoxamine 5'-phosphate oxidase
MTSPFQLREELPTPLPETPMPMVAEWLDEATTQKVQPNPSAMTLATIDPDGRPSARIVLCRGLDVDRGVINFYTNRRSRKGAALEANPRAALVMHWDTLDRQIRIEGPVTHASDAESDAYFASRHPTSRIGAWASDQSQPIASRDALLDKVVDAVSRFGVDLDNPENIVVPRPPHWGGYRVWAESVELWLGSPVRIHDRARWDRVLTPSGDGFAPGAWRSTRLQP